MRFQANTDIAAWRLIDGEAVIVHAETSAYYGLNSSATFIWQSLLNGGLGAGEIEERVRARYGIRDGSIKEEVDRFLASLATEGLVREVDGARAADPAAANAGAPPDAALYQPPQLERFGELEQLVLSGE